MAKLQTDTLQGGRLVDRDGRRQVVLVDVNAAKLVTDQVEGGLLTDQDGREYVAVQANQSSLASAPADGSITDAKISPAGLSPAKITGTAVVTADARLSDQRTPVDASVTDAKLAPTSRVKVVTNAPLNPLYPEYGVKFDGATDDTTAWGLALAALPAKGGEIYVPPNGTSIISQIVVPIGLTDVTIKGGGSSNGNTGSCRLLSHYAGAGAVFAAQAQAGMKLSGLQIQNDNAAFTGIVLDLSRGAGAQSSDQLDIHNIRVNAVAQAGSAVKLISIAQAQTSVLRDVYGSGGKYAIDGLTAIADANNFCNAITIGNGCLFTNQDVAAIHNLGNGCKIEGVTFEPLRSGAAGAYLQDAAIPCPGILTWGTGNWTGDASASGSWIIFNGLALYVVGGDFDVATDGIKLNGTTGLLSVGGSFSGETNGINFNGQIVRAFRDKGIRFASVTNKYAGTSTGVGAGGGEANGPPAVQVAKTAVQSITQSTATAISWDAANFDTLGSNVQWAIGSPTRLVAQAPGLYRLSACVVWASQAASGDRAVWFRLNGSTWLPGSRGAPNSLTSFTAEQATTLRLLNAGDFVECYVNQATAGALNVAVTDTGLGIPTTFEMEKVG